MARLLNVALPILLLCLPAGCREEETAPKHRTVEGIIERIDADNAQVTLRFYSDKRQVERMVTGTVTPETEIMINGVLSSLDELRIGERVTVAGRVQGHGGDQEVIAVKVVVERARTIRRQAATPGDDPAAGTPARSPEPTADGAGDADRKGTSPEGAAPPGDPAAPESQS